MPRTKEKTVRMREVAKAAGVSLTTVGQVLLSSGGRNVRVSEKTADRVRQVAKRLNYTPNSIARQLAGKKSNIIGVLIDPTAAPQSTNRLAIIENMIHQRGYRLMIGHPMNDPLQTDRYVEDFMARGVEGVICIHHAYPGSEKLVPQAVQRLRNVVFIKKPAIANACYVEIDEMDGTRQIVEHLRRQGAQRIAMALTDEQWPGNKQRLAGYLNSNADRPELVWLASHHVKLEDAHHIDEDIAGRIADDLVRNCGADAIIAFNDFWAARLVLLLKRQGIKVPETVRIVGYDNLDIGTYIEPPLTTLDPLHQEAAQKATDMLFDLIDHKGQIPETSRVAIVKTKLLVRQSA